MIRVKVHENHIEAFGFISDWYGETRYGVTDQELIEKLGAIEPEYTLIFKEVFIPNGQFYYFEGIGRAPIGTLEIWVEKQRNGMVI